MVVGLFALLDAVVVDARRHPTRAGVLQAHPVDGVAVFDLFPIHEAVVPKVHAATPVRHQLVDGI